MYRYLALGDSFTCGTGIAAEDSYPFQLADQLQEKGIQVATPTVIAQDGWPTDELRQGIVDAAVTGTFDLVTLLIGVNNQYDGEAEGHTLETYHQQFTDLLQTAITFAGGKPKRVIVISIPDWSAVPGAAGPYFDQASQEIDTYNDYAKTESTRRGAHFVDITPLTRKAANDPSLVASDGRHYTGKMYAQWVQALLPAVDLS